MTPYTRAKLAVPLIALALFSHPLAARAQAPPPPASASLDVSPSQQSRISARQGQFGRDFSALRADTTMPVAQKQAKYSALMQAMNKDIMSILTPAQRAQEMKRQQISAQFQKDVAALRVAKGMTDAQKKARYLALVHTADAQTLATMTAAQRVLAQKQRQAALAQQQAAAARQQANKALVADATRMGKELQDSLSPDQAKKIHAIASASGAQIQAVVADKSVSEQAKPAKITALRQQAQARINDILTAAQRAKYARIQQMVTGAAQ